jgi:hypothetical protein
MTKQQFLQPDPEEAEPSTTYIFGTVNPEGLFSALEDLGLLVSHTLFKTHSNANMQS